MGSFLLLLATAASFLTSPVEEVVLHNGTVIAVENLVGVERGRLIFENGEGTLYSIRLSEVDVEATDARLPANRQRQQAEGEPAPARSVAATALPKKLPVSDDEKKRILEEMERRSHTGRRPAASAVASPVEPSADLEVEVEGETDEWKWRYESRRLEAGVERAKQELAAAKQRERELNDLLLFYAGSSGDATNYSYLVYQLADLRSLIPNLKMAVEAAENALAQFRDDARRQGIPPGWLR